MATRTRWMSVASGSAALHNIALVALPLVDPVPNAALADADQDGMADLIDYAFGLHAAPNNQLPQGQRLGDNYVIDFTQPAGVTNITYGAEFSTSLLPDSWIGVPDSGSAGRHIFSVPVPADGKLFLRLKVTGP